MFESLKSKEQSPKIFADCSFLLLLDSWSIAGVRWIAPTAPRRSMLGDVMNGWFLMAGTRSLVHTGTAGKFLHFFACFSS